jgi:large subunit ribosomal protein L10
MDAHVAKWKFEEVKQLTDLITENKIIGIIEIGGIPAPQMQQMRRNLHNVVIIRSAKNNLILKALDEAEKQTKGISGLKKLIKGQSAIITTDMNPFQLFKQIKSTRTMAPAKGGETATYDIEVKEGVTPFKPGPIVGELQKVGIPAAIQEGKVVIKTDKIIVPKGEKISQELAQILSRLDIYPIEIGMTLNGIYEDGGIFKPEVLDIDMDAFLENIKQASFNALNLAINAGWTNKDTIEPLLMKAHYDAFILALEQGIQNKETIKHLISKAYANMQALRNKTNS